MGRRFENRAALAFGAALTWASMAIGANAIGDDLLIRPEKPSTVDSIRVDVPVKACGDRPMFITTSTSRVTGNVIALAVEQNGATSCNGQGDSVTTRTFAFFLQPLRQGNYTINFTRAMGRTVDLQRSSTFVVSAPFGGNAMPTMTHMTVLLLPLVLLVAEALVIAAPPNRAFDRMRRWMLTLRGDKGYLKIGRTARVREDPQRVPR